MNVFASVRLFDRSHSGIFRSAARILLASRVQLSRWGVESYLALSLPCAPVCGQSILFDFENAPVHSSLPLNLTVGGVTAFLSATGQGFSIQSANTMGFTPQGFSGACLYPNSVFLADLLIEFSQPMTGFSILYAPQELACDSSARLKVTAFRNGVQIGVAVTNAQAGTWPSETLAFDSAQTFDRVVVHYDAPPVTGGDWGPIFMADNMQVTLAPVPPVLTNAAKLPNGDFAFSFAGSPGTAFTVLGSVDLSTPLNQWASLGTATEFSPGQYQFTDSSAGSISQRFYCVRSQ